MYVCVAMVLFGGAGIKSNRSQQWQESPSMQSASASNRLEGALSDDRVWEVEIRPWLSVSDELDYELVDVDSQGTDVILISQQDDRTELRRIDGSAWDEAGGKLLWKSVVMRDSTESDPNPSSMFRWRSARRNLPVPRSGRKRARLVRPAPDLDGDEIGDLVWYTSDQAGCTTIAFSGASGERLWSNDELDFPWTRLLCKPLICDADGDGKQDLIVCCADPQGSAWLSVIRGHDGVKLWRRSLSTIENATRHAKPVAVIEPRVCGLTTLSGESWIAVEDRLRVRFFRVGDGVENPRDISPAGIRFRPAQFHDLDGDGSDEAILFRKHSSQEMAGGRPAYAMLVWDYEAQRPRLQTSVSSRVAERTRHHLVHMLSPGESGGSQDLLLCDRHDAVLSLQRIESTRGRSVWEIAPQLTLNPRAINGVVIECGDLNEDGVREILVVSLDVAKRKRDQPATFIDLFSGSNGDRLSSALRPLPEGKETVLLGAEFMSQPAGAKHLIVATARPMIRGLASLENSLSVDIVSPTANTMLASVRDIDEYRVCDLDGSGRQRLCIARRGFDSTTLSIASLRPRDTGNGRPIQGTTHYSAAYLGATDYQAIDRRSDPRWLEPLPWTNLFAGWSNSNEDEMDRRPTSWVHYVGLAQLTFVGVFLIPGWLILSSLSAWQWSLQRWLMLPAVVGMAIAIGSSFAHHVQTELLARSVGLSVTTLAFLVPLLSWTLLLLPLEFIVMLRRRDYVAIGGLLMVISFLAIAVGYAWALPVRQNLHPEVHFDWSGWYLIWLYVAYLTGWAYLLALGLYHLSTDPRVASAVPARSVLQPPRV